MRPIKDRIEETKCAEEEDPRTGKRDKTAMDSCTPDAR